jgi:K+-transporting ATPase ATPase C chain
MWQQLGMGLRMMLALTFLTGGVYPGMVTGLCQYFFHDQANGSLIVAQGQVIGSRLIGQNFKKDEYFQSRPSASGYDAQASGGANDGPTSQKLTTRVKGLVDAFRKANPDFSGPIPADLVTTSFSGLDPHISPASAQAQVARIARVRGIPLIQVQNLIAQHVEGRDLAFLGEPRVNVLMVNLALDNIFTPSNSQCHR